jgi:hypothetical protein
MSRRAGVVSGSVSTPLLDPELVSDVCPATNAEKQPKITMADWPLRSYLELGALPTAIPCFRLHVKHVLWEWGLDEFSDSVELVVSELTTNAVAVSAGLTGSGYRGRWRAGVPPVRLWIYSDKARVLVQVWDGDNRIPQVQGIDLLAESGRGLLLVESLSQEWGVFVPKGSSGKCVWASMSNANNEEDM